MPLLALMFIAYAYLVAEQLASTSWLRTPDWWQEMANGAFYLIGSAVFQRLQYH
jgi:hypothetical protein